MFALINDNQLILGPIEFNYRLINSTLEDDLEINYKISPSDYLNVPLIITENIKLLKAQKILPPFDPNYEEIFLSSYDVIDNQVIFKYEKREKDFNIVKDYYKSLISAERWRRETFNHQEISINGINILVSTSRESRISLISKLTSGNGPYKFKFGENWIEITSEDIKNIISKIDEKIQLDFDWEYEKLIEIDLCSSLSELQKIDFFIKKKSIEYIDRASI